MLLKTKLIKAMSLIIACVLSVMVLLTGCGGSDENSAVDCIKRYVSAMEAGDQTAMYECYDPNIQSVSSGLTNTIGSIFGISNAYDLGLGSGTVLNKAFMDSASYEITYKYKEVIKNELGENERNISVKYEMTVTSKDDSSESMSVLVMMPFVMTKHDGEWYIYEVQDCVLLSDAEGNELEVPEIQIDEGRAFSDGVAWIKSNEIWKCIDKTGEILFELESKHKPLTDFANGIALIESSDSKYVVDKSGNIVISPEKQGFDEICYITNGANNNLKKVLWNGKAIVVEKEISTFDSHEIQIGVLNAKGEWISKLSSDNPAIGENGFAIRSTSTYRSFYYTYSGEELWFPLYPAGYYCPETNVILDAEEDLYNLSMADSKGIVVNSWGDIYRVDEKGVSSEPILDADRDTIGKYSEGLFYADASTRESKAYGFYNLNGELVIDLSQYEMPEYSTSIMQNGKALINFKNPAGDEYFTIIDKTGNRILEPMEGEATIYGDILFVKTVENSFVIYEYYDIQGNRIFENIDGEISNINENIAMVTTDTIEGIYYIDMQSNKLF